MPFTPTPINVKDATGAAKPVIAYNDGTNNAFAQAVLNSAGGIVNPATADNQATANSALATIATQTNGLANATAQATGNTSLATVATNTANVDAAVGAKADAAAGSDTGTSSLIALVKRALQNWTTLLARVPAADNAKVSVIPSMTTGGNTSAQTAATGTNWAAFASQALKQLTVSNQTGVTLEFRQGGAGVGFQVPTGAFFPFYGVTNASQIEVRRADTSNSQVTVTARWES